MSGPATLPARPSSLPEDAQYTELFHGGLRCWQPRRGYRFSIDAMLLAMAAAEENAEDVLELGTGAGVVLLALGAVRRFRRMVGLELQADLAACARENARQFLPPGLMQVVEGDLRTPPALPGGDRFDLVVSNPPYYPVAEGHVNADSQRAIARHEICCCLDDVLGRTAASLRPAGAALFIYPAPRANAVLASAGDHGLAVHSYRHVRSRGGYPPRQTLLRLVPSASAAAPETPAELSPLDLHDDSGRHTGAVAAFFQQLAGNAPLT